MRKHTRFVALFLVALCFVTASFALCGCDTLRNIMDNLGHYGGNSGSEKEKESENSAEYARQAKVVKTNVRKDSGSNKLVPASDVIARGLHDDVTVESWYDDDNYCYIVYLGRIENFILHDIHTFQYTEDYRVYGKVNVKLNVATTETVETSYKRTVQRSTSRTIESSLKTSLGAKVTSKKGVFEDEVSANIEGQLKNTWSSTLVETSEDYYRQVVTRSEEITRELTLDYDECKDGMWYNYAICTDIDVYAAVCYNVVNADVTYNYYTDTVGKIGEKVFSSTGEDFTAVAERFELDLSSFVFEKPENYISNHPVAEITCVGAETKLTVQKGTTVYPRITFDEVKKKDGTTAPALKYYYENGYRHIDIKVEMNFNSALTKMHIYICPVADRETAVFHREELKNGYKTFNAERLELSRFVDFGVFYIGLRNANVLDDFVVSGIKVTIKIYR